MNKFLCLLVVLSIGCRNAEPQPISKSEPFMEPQPILVIIEQNPWLMVVGSDSPTLVLYDNGTMIYTRKKPTPQEPFHVRTVPDPSATVKAVLQFDPGDMKPFYRVSTGSDQTTTVIWTPTKTVALYGDWREMPHLSLPGREYYPDTSWNAEAERSTRMWEREMELWTALPVEIRAGLFRVDRERSIEGTAWLPPTIEVMFWPYEYAPDRSIIWPKEWPGLHSRDTRDQGDDHYSVFLPSGKLSELYRFLATRRETGAVLIDGKKMAASVRFPFPCEEAWMN